MDPGFRRDDDGVGFTARTKTIVVPHAVQREAVRRRPGIGFPDSEPIDLARARDDIRGNDRPSVCS